MIKITTKLLYLICIYFVSFNNAILHFIPNDSDAVLNIVKNFLPDNPVILEAGACYGEDTVKISEFWPKAQIYAFEPVPELYKILQNNISSRNNILSFKCALGEKSGFSTFYVSEFKDNLGVPSQSSSLLQPKEHLTLAPHVVFNKQITVPVKNLDEWAKENNIYSIDFMWLDLQGLELSVIKSSPKIMKTVKVIYTEIGIVEAYSGQCLDHDMYKWLEAQGFELVAKTYDAYTTWCGDVIFVKQ